MASVLKTTATTRPRRVLECCHMRHADGLGLGDVD